MWLNCATGLMVLIIGIVAVTQRARALLNPLLHFAIGQIIFYSVPPTFAVEEVGLVHLLTGISVVAGFCVAYIIFRPRSDTSVVRFVDRPLVQLTVVLLGITITIAMPVVAIVQGKSLFEVLTNFYTREGSARVDLLVRAFWAPLYRVPIIAIVLGRIWLHLRPNRILLVSWLVLLGLQLVFAFSTGVRSLLVYVCAGIVLADTYSVAIARVRLTTLQWARLWLFHGSVIVFVVAAIAFLTLFRATKFRSADDMASEATRSLQSGALSQAGGDAALQNLNECVAFTMTYYQDNPCWGQGVFAQVANVIPRAFWLDKPEGFGRVAALDMLGSKCSPGHNICAGIGGEAFFNLGWSGVPAFGVLFGVFFGTIYARLLRTGDLLSAACLLLLVGSSILMTRGDWISMVHVPVYQAVSCYICVRLTRLVLGRPSPLGSVTCVADTSAHMVHVGGNT